MVDCDQSTQKDEEAVSQGEVELLTISTEAVSGNDNVSTFILQSNVQGQEVVMLVDSGSSHCFASEDFAKKLKGVQQSINPVQVRVANGGILECMMEIPCCQWRVQGHQFCTTFKILPIHCYEVILGVDWLEQHSPMQVHWLKKMLTFDHKGRTICLRGIKPSETRCCLLWGKQLDSSNSEYLLSSEVTEISKERRPRLFCN